MINDRKTIWKCVICGKPTGTLHEVFFGSDWRDKSIKYNLQVPLCIDHHHEYHTSTVKGLQNIRQLQFCDHLLVDRDDCLMALRDKKFRYILADIADICRQKIEELEI
jgi:hypothetical protein